MGSSQLWRHLGSFWSIPVGGPRPRAAESGYLGGWAHTILVLVFSFPSSSCDANMYSGLSTFFGNRGPEREHDCPGLCRVSGISRRKTRGKKDPNLFQVPTIC